MSSAFLYLGIVVMWLCVLVPMWLRRDRHAVEHADAYDDGDTLTDVSVPSSPLPADPDADTMNLPLLTRSSSTDPATEPEQATAPDLPSHTHPTTSHTDSSTRTEATPRTDSTTSTEATRRTETIAHTESPSTSRTQPATTTPPTPHPETSTSTTDSPSPTDDHQDPGRPEDPASTSEARRRARIMARRRQGLLWSVLIPLGVLAVAIAGLLPWWSVPPSLLLLAGYLSILRVSVQADRDQRAAAEARAARDRRTRELQEAEERAAEQAQAEILEFRSRIKLFDQHADRRRASGD
ncbi:hypothetical protein GCM10009677_61280 [Sphaerisporangium rubeum]|uniref:Uncharacterized protein n=1 Tax=Sphaerisporangium rubeum TaxID=321317 RepID=A0A7X0IJN4_9ACTN|nr:hypothetical protein [Sphaerisporangium rubeum]MBB6476437.1 hypothetical protein [Sphaerisporangium rubeum]